MGRLWAPTDIAVSLRRPSYVPHGEADRAAGHWDHLAMSCTCAEGFTVQLHDGGTRYPVVPVDRHTEISCYFDARCTKCNAKYEAPFARADSEDQVLADQKQDLPMVDWLWFRGQCGPFTCGCDEDSLAGDPATPGP